MSMPLHRASTAILPAGLCCLLLLLPACHKAANLEATPAPVSAGAAIDDAVITASVNAALMAEPAVRNFDMHVRTDAGVVQLSGYVDNQNQVDMANQVLQGLSGIKRIDNRLVLKGSPASLGESVDDLDITGRVKSALQREEGIRDLDIGVVTRRGEATLSGFVNTQNQVDQVVRTTRTVAGVQSVQNELSVRK